MKKTRQAAHGKFSLPPKPQRFSLRFLMAISVCLLLPLLQSVTPRAVDQELCKGVPQKEIADLLRNSTFQEVKLILDHEKGLFQIGNSKTSFKINPYKINKPGYNWVYSVNDIQSIRHELKWEKNKCFLILEFEGNQSEIKGECPGCLKRFEDRRAPDIQWESPRIAKIELKPIAFQNSASFQVEKVDLSGKFEINGPTDILNPALNTLEIAIKKEIEKQFKKYLNSPEAKQKFAQSLSTILKNKGITNVKKVYSGENQLFFCQ
jgi:hypothetical protein